MEFAPPNGSQIPKSISKRCKRVYHKAPAPTCSIRPMTVRSRVLLADSDDHRPPEQLVREELELGPSSVLKPSARSCEKCVPRSSTPSPGVMKPKPFASVNHFLLREAIISEASLYWVICRRQVIPPASPFKYSLTSGLQKFPELLVCAETTA